MTPDQPIPVKITRNTRTAPLSELDRVLAELALAGVNLPHLHAGYSEHVLTEWRKAGAVPLRGLYALKGVLAEVAPSGPNHHLIFTEEELFALAAQLSKGNPARKRILSHLLKKESV